MGMFNEVYATCPTCDTGCEMQIPQIVLGFGCFNLVFTDSLKELTTDQKLELQKYVNERSFECYRCGPFQVEIKISSLESTKTIVEI